MNPGFTSRVRNSAKPIIQFREDRNSRFVDETSQIGVRSRSGSFVPLSQLRRLRECDQVAAICYRVRGGMIEFLLVQTRRGRWTFPKGRAEPGLTHAQAAALEAFEEAGVHGRMEEASFTQYVYRKRRGERGASADLAVSAHLCEVLRLEAPEEAHRTPTWFSPEDTRRCLREDHRAGSGIDMARVVDRAVRRVRRLQNEKRTITTTKAAQVIEIDHLREMQGTRLR